MQVRCKSDASRSKSSSEEPWISAQEPWGIWPARVESGTWLARVVMSGTWLARVVRSGIWLMSHSCMSRVMWLATCMTESCPSWLTTYMSESHSCMSRVMSHSCMIRNIHEWVVPLIYLKEGHDSFTWVARLVELTCKVMTLSGHVGSWLMAHESWLMTHMRARVCIRSWLWADM